MKTRKILIFMSSLSIFLAFIVVSVVLFWELYPYKTVVFNGEFKVMNENRTIKQGDNMVLLVDYCKFTTEVPAITRHFVDGLIYDVASTYAAMKPVGCGNITIFVEIPKNLPTGQFVLQSVYHYHPNPIRSIYVSVNTERFTVTK